MPLSAVQSYRRHRRPLKTSLPSRRTARRCPGPPPAGLGRSRRRQRDAVFQIHRRGNRPCRRRSEIHPGLRPRRCVRPCRRRQHEGACMSPSRWPSASAAGEAVDRRHPAGIVRPSPPSRLSLPCQTPAVVCRRRPAGRCRRRRSTRHRRRCRPGCCRRRRPVPGRSLPVEEPRETVRPSGYPGPRDRRLPVPP